ncbi:MAG: ribbon-helix-helix domain-containing protein [Alphaproteobacteria bacterium]|nr:ribbon-helix-helix domain-containing protein [Alphaproteobacteria bacterium]
MKKYSVIIAKNHTTSISLEEEFYHILCILAQEQNLSPNELITQIDKNRTTTNLSSAIRLYILKNLQQKANL